MARKSNIYIFRKVKDIISGVKDNKRLDNCFLSFKDVPFLVFL